MLKLLLIWKKSKYVSLYLMIEGEKLTHLSWKCRFYYPGLLVQIRWSRSRFAFCGNLTFPLHCAGVGARAWRDPLSEDRAGAVVVTSGAWQCNCGSTSWIEEAIDAIEWPRPTPWIQWSTSGMSCVESATVATWHCGLPRSWLMP